MKRWLSKWVDPKAKEIVPELRSMAFLLSGIEIIWAIFMAFFLTGVLAVSITVGLAQFLWAGFFLTLGLLRFISLYRGVKTQIVVSSLSLGSLGGMVVIMLASHSPLGVMLYSYYILWNMYMSYRLGQHYHSS